MNGVCFVVVRCCAVHTIDRCFFCRSVTLPGICWLRRNFENLDHEKRLSLSASSPQLIFKGARWRNYREIGAVCQVGTTKLSLTMRRLLYSQILKQARCVDNHPPTKFLLAAIPTAVWSRINSKIVYMDETDVTTTTTVSNCTAAELSKYLNQHFTIDSMVSKLNDNTEFYLPPSSTDDSTVSLSLKEVVQQTRRQAALLRQQLHTTEQKQCFDAFFDDLGFEAVREGGALLQAQQNLFSSTPLPKVTLPFQLEPPSTTRYKYKKKKVTPR